MGTWYTVAVVCQDQNECEKTEHEQEIEMPQDKPTYGEFRSAGEAFAESNNVKLCRTRTRYKPSWLDENGLNLVIDITLTIIIVAAILK